MATSDVDETAILAAENFPQKSRTIHFESGHDASHCGHGYDRTKRLDLVTCKRCMQGLLKNANELRLYCENALRRRFWGIEPEEKEANT